MRLVRQDELQRRNDVRRCAQQHLALGQPLGNQTELVVLEITQPPVDELRARRRCMRSEVVLFDQQDLQPAPCGVARDTGAVDPAADDGEVVGRGVWGGHAGDKRGSADSTAAPR